MKPAALSSRGKSLKPKIEPRRKPYQRKDNKKLHILNFLNSGSHKTNGATVNEIKGAAGSNVQGFDPIMDALNDMVKDGWVERDQHGKRFVIYRISIIGTQVLSEALRLCNENHPLTKLEAFRGLIDEPIS